MGIKYRNKPEFIEAVQWNSDDRGNQIGGWPKSWGAIPKTWKVGLISLTLFIDTPVGETGVLNGDWIVRTIDNKFFVHSSYMFLKHYEKVEE